MSNKRFLVAGLLVALLIAGVVSYYASSSPDGLTRVAEDHGIAATEERHSAEDSPLGGYTTKGVADPRLAGGLAGVLGVTIVLLLAGGVAFAVRRRDSA